MVRLLTVAVTGETSGGGAGSAATQARYDRKKWQ